MASSRYSSILTRQQTTTSRPRSAVFATGPPDGGRLRYNPKNDPYIVLVVGAHGVAAMVTVVLVLLGAAGVAD